jgi:hypothetical protein
MMVGLMIRTGIAVSTWEQEGPEVIETAIDLLAPASKEE